MNKKYYLAAIFAVLTSLFIYEIIFSNNTVSAEKKTENKTILDQADKVMIVAHADDDLLWGGMHLIKDHYLVVCVTCGFNELRLKEFEKAMDKVNSPYLALGHTETENGHASNWYGEYDEIAQELSGIVNYKKWDQIVTHNPDGEYGHRHHRWISNMVTSASSKVNLYYFDRYREKTEDVLMTSEQLELLKLKEEYLKVYESQSAIVDNHRHTIMHENFISYYDWDNETKLNGEIK